jgi:hypothetical protein
MAISREIRDLEQGKFADVDSKPAVRVTSGEEAQVMDLVSDTVFYFGYAAIGTVTTAAKWKITKLTIAGTLISVTYADGNDSYDNIWEDRLGLTYV